MRVSWWPKAVCLALMLLVGGVQAQETPAGDDREAVGYMLGLDAGRSIGPGLPDMDPAAFQRAVENAMAGGAPLLPPA